MAEKARVLIVTDDHLFADAISDILNEKGCEATSVNSAEEALKKVKEMTFEVILMEIMMPGMNGITAYKQMKNIDRNLRVVLMTGYALESWVVLALQLGADGVLYKPFDPDIVLKNILSKDVIEIYQGYFDIIWDRLEDIAETTILVTILEEVILRNMSQEGSLLSHLEVSEKGVSFEKLKKELGESQPPKLRGELKRLIAQTFEALDRVGGKESLARQLTRDLSDNLKGYQLQTNRLRAGLT